MKKGFTLIELLGVIVILAVIATILSISIIKMVENTNGNIDSATEKILFSASEEYLNENFILPANGNYTVTVKTLIENNKINSTFIESQNNESVTNNSCVKVNITNGVMNYEFSYTCE
ncbi:MAG: type II secretion system protein [Bacilli bacterium]|nr:type II secretion system protein [Bacilli bacterium]